MARAAPPVGQGPRLASAGPAGHRHRQGATPRDSAGAGQTLPHWPKPGPSVSWSQDRIRWETRASVEAGAGFEGEGCSQLHTDRRCPSTQGQLEQSCPEGARGRRSQDRLLEDTRLLLLSGGRKQATNRFTKLSSLKQQLFPSFSTWFLLSPQPGCRQDALLPTGAGQQWGWGLCDPRDRSHTTWSCLPAQCV